MTKNKRAPFEAINWNSIEDRIDEATWRKLTEQFWLDTRIPVSDDGDSWRTLTLVERDVMNKVLAGLTMLDTLQSEDGVDSLFGDVRTKQETAVLANIQFMECLTEDNKVLTPEGWVSVKSIKKGDTVMQYSTSGVMEFAEVTNVSNHIPDEIHRFKSVKFDMKTSGGHRMYLESKELKNNECTTWLPKVVEARDYNSVAKTAHRRNVLMGKSFEGGITRSLTSKEKLFIAIQADGSIRKARIEKDTINRITASIGFKKDRKVNKLREILKELILDFGSEVSISESEDKGYTNFYITADKEFFEKFDHNKNLYDVFDLSTLSQETAVSILNEMKCWDSHVADHDGEVIVYYTSNESNANFMKAIATMSARPFVENIDFPEKATKPGYAIRITEREASHYMSLQGKVDYEILPAERVYGIEVPSSFLVVMTPGGPIVTGNCVHAKSYSTIFSTFNSPREIDEIFEWIKDNKYIQYKAHKIRDIYLTGTPLERKVASVFLESFMFYSGFYTPLRFLGESRMVNTAELIKLIIRDESVHGTYIGYKFQIGFNELSQEEQEKMTEWIYELGYELYDNEVKYTAETYGEIGWAKDVNVFLEYNMNKSLANMGLPPMFPTTAKDVNPVIMNGLSTTSSNHDFFSQVGNGYLLGAVEAVTNEDFINLEEY